MGYKDNYDGLNWKRRTIGNLSDEGYGASRVETLY